MKEIEMSDCRKILVTGDTGRDFDIYLHSEEDNPPLGTPPARVAVSIGGAGIVFSLLQAVARGCTNSAQALEVGFQVSANRESDAPPISALWYKYSLGQLGKTPDDQDALVWRTKRSINLGSVIGSHMLPAAESVADTLKDFAPDVVVIEDNAGGFRYQSLDTLDEINRGSPPSWIILKSSAPICRGLMWWDLMGNPVLADRLIVIVSLGDLRRADVRISQGISWERTAEDLAREFSCSPELEGLRRARHIVVTIHGEGAFWMERVTASEQPPGFKYHLIFDPAHMEREWSERMCGKGEAYGFHSCFAATLAVHLAWGGGEVGAGIQSGIRHGLWCMRLLRVRGHGLADEKYAMTPGLPVDELARIVMTKDMKSFAVETEKLADQDWENDKDKPVPPCIEWGKLGLFGYVDVPVSPPVDPAWRILQASDPVPSEQPMYGMARRVALLGLNALQNVPHASFGKLFTVDRDEIEALRNIKRLILNYRENKKENKPLSIAVFGPPGAGKSFGIKEIAGELLAEKGKEVPCLEFNLSQFSDVKDLIGAFHQVRDKVLQGQLPLVFWDEFDSENYRWLQYLLAPMQDGKFQEGQLTHPIGRCIFVFAGATSYDIDNFGPPEKPWTNNIEMTRKFEVLTKDFQLKKGPDFKSRLHGHLNVLGPNQRQRLDRSQPSGRQWVDDPSDVCFPVRRAILLRAWLGLMDPSKKQSRKRLEMDSGLLSALLEVGHYRHGARSMEKIVECIKKDGGQGYHRSGLPPDEILAMNVLESGQFKEILEEDRLFQRYGERLAPAVHAAWFPSAEQGNVYQVGFSPLPPEGKGDNYSAVARMPRLLGLVGLQLVDKCVDRPEVTAEAWKSILLRHRDFLAAEEHNLWMEIKVANGWLWEEKPADDNDGAKMKAQRARRRHHCLVAYDKLPDREQKKDHQSIENIPTIAELAGFKIVYRGMPSHR
jgi:hypothetical protein